jgi:hypothetical protein
MTMRVSSALADCDRSRKCALPVWNIAEQPIQDQFDYWHDVICEVFIPMTPKRSIPGVGFASGVEARALGDVSRTDVWSQAPVRPFRRRWPERRRRSSAG